MATSDRTTHGSLACPSCGSYAVQRMYVAQIGADACACSGCGERWDEDKGSGARRGRSDRASVLLRPKRR
jgi:transposase-like protein